MELNFICSAAAIFQYQVMCLCMCVWSIPKSVLMFRHDFYVF